MTRLKEPITVTIECVEKAVILCALLRSGTELETIILAETGVNIKPLLNIGEAVGPQISSKLEKLGINWRTWKAPDPIRVGGNSVEFHTDSIEVGCTTVSNETVLEIAKRIQEAQCS